MVKVQRAIFVSALLLASALAAPLTAQTFCAKPKPVPQPPPADPFPPVCEPKNCDKCTKSPCYLLAGSYVDEWIDLQIKTAGTYPLTVSRRYDSARSGDGPLGVGWSSSLTARLYYAAYLRAAPDTYSYEANVMMPEGTLSRFTTADGSSFSPPAGRYDALVRYPNGTWTLTPQHTRSVYAFNADGSLASLTDEFGNAITWSYDASGRVQRVADTAGSARYLDVTWGADGRIASVTDSSGRVLKYFYETGDGALTSVADPSVSSDASKRSRYYGYAAGRMGLVISRIEDRWHRVVSEIDWSPDGRVKSIIEGRFDGTSSSEGEKYTYLYDASGTVTKSHSLGSKPYTVSTTGPASDSTTQYGASGAVTNEATPAGPRIYSYNTRGNVATVTQPITSGLPWSTVIWSYTYDSAFPDKVASILPKDFVGNLSSIWAGWVYGYNAPGTIAAGALARVWRIRSDKTTKDLVASYTYDARGRLLTASQEGYVAASYSYNAAGDLMSAGIPSLTTYGYDALGRQTSVTTADGHITTFTYDELDRVTSVTLPRPSAGSTLDFVTTYSYDNYDAATGLLFTHVTDPNGRVTKTGQDALGHVVRTVDAAGNVTAFTYQYGLLKKITDANNNVTTYSYTSRRELSATTFPDGAAESYTIIDGVLHSRTDRKGQQVSYTYDGAGRITRISYPGIYDPFGHLAGQEFVYAQQTTQPGGEGQVQGQNLATIYDYAPAGMTTINYTYDSSWRRVTETVSGGEKTTYTYVNIPHPSSRLESYRIEPASGTPWNPQTVTYGYDGYGRVTMISWNWIPSGSFSFEYTPAGQYKKMTFPNGQTRTYSYDNQDRMTNVSNNDPVGSVLASFTYGYDYDWASASYTMLGQRTSVLTSAPAGTNLAVGNTKYRYDSRYQLTRVDYPNGQFETWTYDAIGNRTSATGIAYEYYKNGQNPLNGQRLRTDHPGWPDLLYDANGNLKGPSNLPNTYVWDYAGRLTSSSGVSYRYDRLGRRLTATTGNNTTKYISFDVHTVAERNTTTGVATDYLFGPGIDEPLAKITASGAVSYYGVDGLGSIVLVTNSSGTITGSTSYGAWGGGAIASELFGFTGREGSFFRARYYDAASGRFISEDPLGFGGGINFYVYALGDPVKYKDPLGLRVYRCCARANIPGNPGLSHCWLKTDTREGGLGDLDVGQSARQAVPNNQCGSDYPFIQTQVVDHTGESVSRSGTRCTEVPDMDEQCVNDEIWTDRRGYGGTQGLWSPTNQCNSFVNDVVQRCRRRRCRPPSPPGDDGRRYF